MHNKLAIIFSIFLMSCTPDIQYVDYNSIDEGWHKDSIQNFNFELSTTEKTKFNSFVNLRINENYIFNNIYLIVTIKDSINIISIDTIEYKLADKYGKFLGKKRINIVDNSLQQPGQGEGGESDWVLEYVAMFQLGKVSEARKLIVNKARAEEYESVYRKLYENLDWFGEDELTKGKALLCIRDGLVNHSLVADPEINLSATLLELQHIAKK